MVKDLIDWENPDTWDEEFRQEFEFASMFGMGDFDMQETTTVDKSPFWIKNWRDKVNDSDNRADSPEQAGW